MLKIFVACCLFGFVTCVRLETAEETAVRRCRLCCSNNASCINAFEGGPAKCCKSRNYPDTCCPYNSRCTSGGDCYDLEPNGDSNKPETPATGDQSWVGTLIFFLFLIIFVGPTCCIAVVIICKFCRKD